MIPRTLDGISIPCISLSVNQSLIPLSNATMEVLNEDTLPIRSYVEISTPNGITEIYRTRQPQESYTSGYSTIQLDHAICEVGDFLVQNAYNVEKTVREAMVTIFSHYRGDKWQLGSFNAPETVILDCDYDNVLETMLAVLEQVPQYYMTFDFSTTPWTVSIAQKSATVTAEGRMSRNIANETVRYDDKDQCTRVYVKGLPKPSGRESDANAVGYMDADAATIAEYGIIEAETGSGNLTEAQATRVAQAYLAAHKHPKKSVEIDGDDLTEITGETLDSFICGKKFRLVVPEVNLVVEDYITKVTFQDALNSSSANVTIGDEMDAAINFLQAQQSSTKASRGARKKQDKLDEQFTKSFQKVDETGAILEQAGMKLDSHGMIVYARDNVNNIGSILDMTASEIRAEVAAGDLGLHSEISQTASAIRLSVDNSLSDVHSSITETADQIRSEVHAANSTVYSFINQTATSIQSVVADVNEDLHSEILQTKSMIRSAVWTANSMVYSYVDQTASYILDHVGERTGAKVFTGMDEPVDSPDNPITTGDLWLDGNYINFWDDADFQYVSYDPDDPEYDWTQLRGTQLKVWKDGEWQLAEDGTTLVEETDIRRTKDQINLVAHNLGKFDGELRSNIARLDVKADKISSTVNERIADVGSRITQTAYEIRSEVHSASSQLYSAIEQTATSIRAYVVDEVNDLGSEILQTASQIRAEVHASASTLYSYVDQTATQIRSVVADEVSGLNSSITQTASQIRAEVTDRVGNLQSQITVNAGNINLKVSKNNVISEINQTSESITIQAAKINLSGYVKATDITASYITTKLENASLVKSGGFQATGTIYAAGAITSGSDVKVTIGSSNVSLLNAYNALQVVSAGNNSYKIQRKSFNNSEWQDVPGTFSRAVASWSVGWSNGKWTAKANPQNQSAWVSIYQGNASWSGRTVSIPIKSVNSESQSTEVTAYTAQATLSASNITLTRSAPQSSEPSTSNTVTRISTNGWYIMYVRVNGYEKQYKIQVNV